MSKRKTSIINVKLNYLLVNFINKPSIQEILNSNAFFWGVFGKLSLFILGAIPTILREIHNTISFMGNKLYLSLFEVR